MEGTDTIKVAIGEEALSSGARKSPCQQSQSLDLLGTCEENILKKKNNAWNAYYTYPNIMEEREENNASKQKSNLNQSNYGSAPQISQKNPCIRLVLTLPKLCTLNSLINKKSDSEISFGPTLAESINVESSLFH